MAKIAVNALKPIVIGEKNKRNAFHALVYNKQFWLGIYLLAYGLMLEASQSAPLLHSEFKLAYEFSIVMLSISVALSARKLRNGFLIVLAGVVLGISMLGFLAVWPWFLPIFNMHQQFGVSELVERGAIATFKIFLIISGVCLVTLALAKPFVAPRRIP